MTQFTSNYEGNRYKGTHQEVTTQQRGSGEFIRFTESHGGGGDDVSGDGEHGCGHDDGCSRKYQFFLLKES